MNISPIEPAMIITGQQADRLATAWALIRAARGLAVDADEFALAALVDAEVEIEALDIGVRPAPPVGQTQAAGVPGLIRLALAQLAQAGDASPADVVVFLHEALRLVER